MVEQHAITHIQDALVPSLNFQPKGNTAEYVQSAKQVRFFFSLKVETGSAKLQK